MREKLREGLGESGTFAGYHPAVNFIFFVFAIGITMFSMDPVFLAVTLLASWAWSILLSGRRAIKFNLLITVPVLLITSVINTLFNHNGATVLFWLFGNRITLEAFVFGLAGAVMLSSVIVWFTSFNVVMTSDKFIYLFGKAAPVLALTLSMIFRFIPLLKSRYKEISMGQRCMGRHTEKKFLERVRQTVKEVSILISWSLEASIETSDSMEARGYGLKGRTSFHLFKFTARDGWLLAFMAAMGLVAAAGCFLGATGMEYYPTIVMHEFTLLKAVSLACYSVLLLTPLTIDLIGEKKWQSSKSEI
ncbi:MAG: energy-coupling factor transporter transmembrane protein EcfT [Firmicutes bacterium]|nr:energy-coupling factor transporter transmembrane protein EcfT [Bacillota bacterium]